jgi:hypothetical protein
MHHHSFQSKIISSVQAIHTSSLKKQEINRTVLTSQIAALIPFSPEISGKNFGGKRASALNH